MKSKIKLFFLTLFLGILEVNAQQQSIKHHADYFVVDDIAFIEIQNCIPNSSIDFYSKRGGGKFIGSETVNDKGIVLCNYAFPTMPAFCSSNKKMNNNNVAGTGSVVHFEQYDFNLSNLDNFVSNLDNKITWKCIIPESKNISFELWKSKDGIQLIKIANIEGIPNSQSNEYEFNEVDNNGYAIYHLKVFNNKTQKYVSKNLVFNGENIYKLYPTISSDYVYIETKMNRDGSNYKVFTESGQFVATGVLNSKNSKIDISSLSIGNYYIQIIDQKEILKFIKH